MFPSKFYERLEPTGPSTNINKSLLAVKARRGEARLVGSSHPAGGRRGLTEDWLRSEWGLSCRPGSRAGGGWQSSLPHSLPHCPPVPPSTTPVSSQFPQTFPQTLQHSGGFHLDFRSNRMVWSHEHPWKTPMSLKWVGVFGWVGESESPDYCRAELNKQSLGLIPEMQRPQSPGGN